MNILKQAKDEEFVKEQFVKGRILDDTKANGMPASDERDELIIGFFEKGYCLDLDEVKNVCLGLLKENKELKRQLKYLRSGEYYNQLRFENKMLQYVVDNGEVSKEDREFIDCTHRNTELLEQQEFIKYLEDMLDDENDIFSVVRVKDILQKYKEIIGVPDDKIN